VSKINGGYFCRNWLIIIAYPDKKPGCRFAPFAFCNFAYLLKIPARFVLALLCPSNGTGRLEAVKFDKTAILFSEISKTAAVARFFPVWLLFSSHKKTRRSPPFIGLIAS